MGVAVGPFAVGGDGVREFVVLVLSAGGGDLLEHLLHVIQERRLVLVDPDSGSRVPGKDDGEAVGDAGLPGGVFDPFRYVDKLRPLVGPDHERLREELHMLSPSQARIRRGGRRFCCRRPFAWSSLSTFPSRATTSSIDSSGVEAPAVTPAQSFPTSQAASISCARSIWCVSTPVPAQVWASLRVLALLRPPTTISRSHSAASSRAAWYRSSVSGQVVFTTRSSFMGPMLRPTKRATNSAKDSSLLVVWASRATLRRGISISASGSRTAVPLPSIQASTPLTSGWSSSP